jgi:hypothetical protein
MENAILVCPMVRQINILSEGSRLMNKISSGRMLLLDKKTGLRVQRSALKSSMIAGLCPVFDTE